MEAHMVKVLTYGTYDKLHYGHIRLLERAKALGDYLIVGVTADDFDKQRGKINVQHTLMERVEAVKALNIADEIIIEEYEGQKIDDIKKYDVDIFTVGSDWEGKFDYLREFCEVIYLERTQGISSTEIRQKECALRVGIIGNTSFLNKIERESHFVNGAQIIGICTKNIGDLSEEIKRLPVITTSFSELLEKVDAIYLKSYPIAHYEQIKEALVQGKHVLCESPLSINSEKCKELYSLAKEKKLVLMEAIKTAYATAYVRLLLLLKSGVIGEVVSVDATCTSLRKESDLRNDQLQVNWGCVHEWAPTALLPIFQILGTNYKEKTIVVRYYDKSEKQESFVKIDFLYENAVGSIKIGDGVKSEGELIISGTKGYIYVPAPWWKTDYFEIRFENLEDNKRYFYQLDGEGIRNELAAFIRAIQNQRDTSNISPEISECIAEIIQEFTERKSLYKVF